MNYTTFGAVKEAMRDAAGGCNDKDLSDLINSARHHFYLWHSEISLFLDAIECFKVQKFPLDCNGCTETYEGVTLPREMQRVEAIWFNDWPMQIRSDWREWQTGISPECACGLQSIDIPGAFPTALEIGEPVELELVALSSADIGNTVVLRGVDVVNRPTTQTLVLSSDPVVTDIKIRSIDRRGGVLKPLTAGRVLLREKGRRVLSIYEPDETMPSYRRVKITGLPNGCQVVNIRGSRKYFPLFDDNDVVETDNLPAFDAMVRYLRAFRKSSKTAADLAIEKDYMATARYLMMGEKSRDQGKSVANEIRIATPRFANHGLNRGRRF
jgi:hypothetical protein